MFLVYFTVALDAHIVNNCAWNLLLYSRAFIHKNSDSTHIFEKNHCYRCIYNNGSFQIKNVGPVFDIYYCVPYNSQFTVSRVNLGYLKLV